MNGEKINVLELLHVGNAEYECSRIYDEIRHQRIYRWSIAEPVYIREFVHRIRIIYRNVRIILTNNLNVM